jgi:hypothetical protein
MRTARQLGLALSLFLGVSCAPTTHESLGSTEQRATSGDVAEKDLAIVFAASDRSAPGANTPLPTGGVVLPASTYATVAAAYEATSVGEAFTTESRYEDWHVVSVRVSPCSPLAPAPRPEAEGLCWPEVRLVLQPILRNIRIHERSAEAYADDRAIHALYDAPAETALAAPAAARARALVAKVRQAAKTWQGGAFAPLDDAERAELAAARDAVGRALVDRARALRDPATPTAAFRGHGERPESASGGPGAKAFASRAMALFGDYVTASALRALTSFSLPEGREPATLDEWVFVSFEAHAGALVREHVTMRSLVDGRTLADLGTAPRATQTRDDDTLYEADSFDAVTSSEIAARAMLGPADITRLAPVVRDPRATHVPNTTCASCHKMNALRFDFHNLGYLEDREVTVSPRVVSDVAVDLAWIQDHLSR